MRKSRDVRFSAATGGTADIERLDVTRPIYGTRPSTAYGFAYGYGYGFCSHMQYP
jgi:hypothetical protein